MIIILGFFIFIGLIFYTFKTLEDESSARVAKRLDIKDKHQRAYRTIFRNLNKVDDDRRLIRTLSRKYGTMIDPIISNEKVEEQRIQMIKDFKEYSGEFYKDVRSTILNDLLSDQIKH